MRGGPGRCPDATDFQIVQIVCGCCWACGVVGNTFVLSTNPQACGRGGVDRGRYQTRLRPRIQDVTGGADLVRGPIGGQPHVGRPSVRAAGSFRLLAVHCSPSGVPAEASPTALGCAAARAHPPLFLHCVIRAKPFSVLPTKAIRRQPLLWGTQNGAIHGRFAHKRCAVGVSRPQTNVCGRRFHSLAARRAGGTPRVPA